MVGFDKKAYGRSTQIGVRSIRKVIKTRGYWSQTRL